MTCRTIRYIVGALASPLAVVALTVPASAAEPTGEYAVFKQCPLSLPFIDSCVYNLTTSGELKIGSNVTPISNPIVFQGGETRTVKITEEIVEGREGPEVVLHEEETRKFVPAANGETLSHSPQPVPGGLLGIVAPESLPLGLGATVNKLVTEGLAGVNATTELVGPAEYSFTKLASHEVGLVMPVRIHLENPALLGSACYIGSASEPITLHLSTGTTSPPPPNKPITGTPGEVEIKNNGKLIVSHNDSAVDNSFSVPVAHGCGGLVLSLVLDPAIDAKLGLPSAAGNNTAILNGTLEQASAGGVRESEK
jgi:hypothetical protein